MMPDKRFSGGSDTRQTGVTFLELVAVMAIIAILAAIAYPSYVNQIRKSKRAVAKSALLDIANREEQFFFANRAYSSKLKDDLNYLENSVCFSNDQSQIICGGTNTVYEVTAALSSCGTDPCFIITATPKNDQAYDACGKFTLTSSNARDVSNTTSTPASECW